MTHGAYGLCLTGAPLPGDLLVAGDATWPVTEILVEHGPVDDARDYVSESRGVVRFADATAFVDREPARVVFRFAGKPRVDAIVHPYLSPVAGLLAHWHGREPFHAGGFVHDGGVWGIVADRVGGKSSTLAGLALQGVPVVTDDLLVLDGDDALAGPRAIDLREDISNALGIGEPLGVLGTRSRWRFRLPPIASACPLRGWVFLAWGQTLSMERISATERLERLGAQRMIRRRPNDPRTLLRLASLPGFVVTRPSARESLAESVAFLRESLPPSRG